MDPEVPSSLALPTVAEDLTEERKPEAMAILALELTLSSMVGAADPHLAGEGKDEMADNPLPLN